MEIDTASLDQVFDVALTMRDSDYAEFSAVSHTRTRGELAEELAMRFATRRQVMCAKKDGKPVAIFDTLELRPRVLTLMFFATADFPKIAIDMTRFVTKRLFPPQVAAGVHRIECVSMEGHSEAHRWIEILGLKREGGPLLKFGKNGETFYQFSWVADVRPSGH